MLYHWIEQFIQDVFINGDLIKLEPLNTQKVLGHVYFSFWIDKKESYVL